MARSFRKLLRAFRAMRGNPPDPGFVADLEFLENRDLDLSVRLGGMLAFNALLITIGTHPISASPGAPISLDGHDQPILVAANMIALAPFVWSSVLCLRALTIGEEFDVDGDEDHNALRLRLMAAFVRSVDVQGRMLSHAIRATLGGGALTILLWAWILAAKIA